MKAFAKRTQVYALHIVVSFIDRFTTDREPATTQIWYTR